MALVRMQVVPDCCQWLSWLILQFEIFTLMDLDIFCRWSSGDGLVGTTYHLATNFAPLWIPNSYKVFSIYCSSYCTLLYNLCQYHFYTSDYEDSVYCSNYLQGGYDCNTHIHHSVVMISKFSFSFYQITVKFWYSFSIPKVLLLDSIFSFGIGIDLGIAALCTWFR